VKARRWIGPKADTAPDFAATRLEPPPSKGEDSTRRQATRATFGSLGAAARGSLDSRSCSRIVFDCRGRRAITPLDHRLLCPPKPPSLARRRRTVAWRITAERLVLLRAVRDVRGQKQVHAPLHGRKRRGSGCAARKVPRSRALTGSGRACSPGDQGHAWIGGSPGCVVKRSLDQRCQRSVGTRTIRRVLVYVGQLQMLKRRIFPQGHGRPKGRQQTSG